MGVVEIHGLDGLQKRYGHATGDEVLRAAAQLILQNLQHREVVARYEPGEIVILFPETPLHTAVRRLEAIRPGLEEILHASDHAGSALGISIGMAQSPADGYDVEVLVHQAEARAWMSRRTDAEPARQAASKAV